jgi:hypothetical protein
MRKAFLIPAVMLAAAASGEEATFARLEADPPAVYAGQPFTLHLSVFTTGQDLEPGMQITGLPDALQLQPFQEMPAVSQTEGGRAYQVLRSRCDAICPQPGRLQFAPVIHGVSSRTIQTFFFVQRVRNDIQIPVRPITLEVKPIPLAQAPKEYAGLIGTFQLAAAVSTNRVLPGDLVTLTCTVSGRGRFDKIPPLGIPDTPGFKVYPPRLETPRSGGTSRTYSQVVIPLGSDSRTIPALKMVAFNPERGTFDTLAAGPFPLVEDAGRHTNQPAAIMMPFLPGPEAPASPPLPIHAALGHGPDDPANRLPGDSGFVAGNRAYDSGDMPDAIDAYAKLLALGYRTPELYANLGAACARNGQTGKAMLYLLRAIRTQPRDPIARNHMLQLLARSAVPFPPALPLWSRLSRKEWLQAAGAALALGLLALGFGRRGAWAVPARFLAGVTLPAAALAAAGVVWWMAGPPFSERVITVPVVQGRLAPTEGSASTARLTEGMVVTRAGASGAWVRVMAGDLAVWIPDSAIEQP